MEDIDEKLENSAKRLKELTDYLKISANKLAAELNLKGNTRIYHVLNKRNLMTSDLAGLIVNRYPEINYKWLLEGEGEMLNTSSNQSDEVTMLKRQLKEKDDEISFLRDMVKRLAPQQSHEKSNSKAKTTG